jgi:predicted membrane-bound mannosyltransferase
MADPLPGDGWLLGGEPVEPHVLPGSAEPVPDRSRVALERPIAVLTVERLAWSLIALWAVLTRMLALGARPLSNTEARNALFEFDLANKTAHAAAAGFHPVWSGWVHLLQAGVFAALGASDFTARLIFALSGLLLVGIAFAMREYVGRAGAIALAAMLAISPSVTYFSRAGSTIVPASAMALVSIALFMALIAQPERRRALRLGLAGGLMLAVGPAGLISLGAFIVAFFLIGLAQLVSRRNAYLGVRVWMDRYAGLAITTVVIAALVALLSEGILPDVVHRVRTFPTPQNYGVPGFLHGLAFYGPQFVLYEFLVVILAVAGALLTLTWRIRSRFAWWCTIWTAVTVAIYLWMPVRTPGIAMAMVVPAALLGAFAIEHLHRTRAWRYVRFPLAAAGLLTVYVQILSNFVYFAPDASEAQWARHLNLAWRDDATTIQAAERCREITRQLASTQASVYFREHADRPGTPALRWYLRSLTVAENADTAAVVVNADASRPASEDADAQANFELDLEQAWQPDLARVETAQALRYLFTEQVWETVATRVVNISVRTTGASSPTVILTPGNSR